MASDTEEARAIAALPGVIAKMEARILAEATPEQARELWACTYVVMGLRYSLEVVNDALHGVMPLIEGSELYQTILAEGKLKGHREFILEIARAKFGEPDKATSQRLQQMSNEEDLKTVLDRLAASTSWQELLPKNDPSHA